MSWDRDRVTWDLLMINLWDDLTGYVPGNLLWATLVKITLF